MRPSTRTNGWINLDKPVGPTSRDCVSAVRRLLGVRKIGHGGTLDPLASGVLPIALGEATKSLPYLVDARKSYRFELAWGERRGTDDAGGEVLETSPVRPGRATVLAGLPRFRGRIEQTPPVFSAVKVGGKRAYKLARAGKPVTLAPRAAFIHSFDLAEMPDPDHAVFDVTCAKGTYVRSLARDLASSLGTVGYVSALRRTAVGPFKVTAAISLAKLTELGNIAAAESAVQPIEAALDDIPALALTAREAQLLRNGQVVSVLRDRDRERIRAIGDDAVVLAKEENLPVAFVRVDGLRLRPIRVLKL